MSVQVIVTLSVTIGLLLLLLRARGGLSTSTADRLNSSTSHYSARHAAASTAAPPFSLSGAIPELFGGRAVRGPRARSALRAQLISVLDSVGPHYSGLLRRVTELHQPEVAALVQVGRGPSGGGQQGNDDLTRAPATEGKGSPMVLHLMIDTVQAQGLARERSLSIALNASPLFLPAASLARSALPALLFG